MRTTLQVRERGLIRRDHAGACPRLDGHVAHGHPLLHREGANDLAGVFDDMTSRATHAKPRAHGENHVLRRHASGQASINADLERLRLCLQETLCREHMRHLRRPDAECHRAECAVRAGMAVAAHHGHARLRQPQLGPDDVHDPLSLVAEREQRDAELLAVPRELLDLREPRAGARIANGERRKTAERRRRGVIHRRDGAMRRAHLQPPLSQLGEGLRRGDFVHEMQVDVQDSRCRVGLGAHDVPVPELLEQCPWANLGHADTASARVAPRAWPTARTPDAGVARCCAWSRQLSASTYASADAVTTSVCAP